MERSKKLIFQNALNIHWNFSVLMGEGVPVSYRTPDIAPSKISHNGPMQVLDLLSANLAGLITGLNTCGALESRLLD